MHILFGLSASLLLYGVWLLLRAFVFDYFVIPTWSMYPTLKPGDEVVVNKLLMGARIYKNFNFDAGGIELQAWRTKGLHPLRHNDIVVFNFPLHDRKMSFVINNVYCKRIVALPGDSLSIVDGYYKNNNYDDVLGLKNEQDKFSHLPDSMSWIADLKTIPFDDHITWTISNFGPYYVPRKGDLIRITSKKALLYDVLLRWETGKNITCDWTTGRVFADGKPLMWHQFKHNYYFMAGDNVLDSDDSRFWGLVPEEYIIGVVDYIYNSSK